MEDLSKMTIAELNKAEKYYERAKLRAHQKREYFGMLICKERLERISKIKNSKQD